MCRAKAVATAVFAVFAASSLAASSATATWLVGGSPLTGTAALATSAVVDEPTKLLVPDFGLVITCSGAALGLVGPRIEGTDKGFVSSLRFLACNVTQPPSGCALEETNQTIATLPLLALASKATGEEDRITLTPETKRGFAEIAFNPFDECNMENPLLVAGSVKVGVPTGQLELLNQALVDLGSSENNSLEASAHKAYLAGGRALLKLQSDRSWGFK
jgi:hypothetical protein